MVDISKVEYLEALEQSGLAGHPGGVASTEAIIRQLDVRQGQRVLNPGCGTGYTACLMAKRQGADVVAADLRLKMLDWTKKRRAREHVTDRVHLAACDVQRLPFRDASFDAAVIESVLVFCDVPVALAELHRVLKPGGLLGCNEVTTTRPMTREEKERFSAFFGIAPGITSADEWARAFREAGFTDIAAEVKPIDWLDLSLFTPLRTDGIKRYLSALVKSLTDPALRKVSRGKYSFIASGLIPIMGSGVYIARKP